MLDGENFRTLYSEYASTEQSRAAREHAKEILDELLGVKAITKRQYNTNSKKCEEQLNFNTTFGHEINFYFAVLRY